MQSECLSDEFEDGFKLGNDPLIIKDTDNTTAITTELNTFYNLGNLKLYTITAETILF
ncbi:MAG: hypothetical protein LBS81_04600 [Endomicrobium sp.]|jgi:hypothetical protein|nr:hypothetical protein [Endomicrobium sp.]